MKEKSSTGVRQAWSSNLLDWGVSVVLPVMLGLILGPLIAFLVQIGFWTVALAFVVAVPVVAVFCRLPVLWCDDLGSHSAFRHMLTKLRQPLCGIQSANGQRDHHER